MATYDTLKTIRATTESITSLTYEKIKVTEQGKYIKLEITKTSSRISESILIPKDEYKNLMDLIEESYYRFFYPTNNVVITKEVSVE